MTSIGMVTTIHQINVIPTTITKLASFHGLAYQFTMTKKWPMLKRHAVPARNRTRTKKLP